MATARILLYNAILFILISGSAGRQCPTQTCSNVTDCSFEATETSDHEECRLWILFKDSDCSLMAIVAGTVETTERIIKNHSSFIGFTTELYFHPATIISKSNKKNTIYSPKYSSYDICAEKANVVLCDFFSGYDQAKPVDLNRCPGLATTPIVSTTTVLEITDNRTAFTNKDVNTTAKIETTEIYETTSTDESSSLYMAVVVRNKAPPTKIATEATPTSTSEETTTDDNSKEGSSLLWLYIVIAILIVLLIAGGVFGFFAWKKKWFKKWFKKDKKKAVKVEPKKAEFPAKGVVLRPHDENPDLLPDNVWKKKGPIRMMKNLKGPIEHKMANDKSEPLNKPIELDFDNMEEYQIGPGIEQYTGESTTLSFGPLPKSDTVRALTHISVSDMSTASKKPSTMEVKKETPKNSKRSKEDATQKE